MKPHHDDRHLFRSHPQHYAHKVWGNIKVAAGLAFLLWLLTLLTGRAQSPFPVDEKTKKITYQDVVRIDSSTAFELHSRAKQWLFTVVRSPKSAVEIDDKESGLLAAKLTYDYKNNPGSPLSRRARMYIPIQLECKDGRYRYTLTNLEYGSDLPGQANLKWPLEKLATDRLGKTNQQVAIGMDNAIRTVLESLKTAMSSTRSEF